MYKRRINIIYCKKKKKNEGGKINWWQLQAIISNFLAPIAHESNIKVWSSKIYWEPDITHRLQKLYREH